MRTRTTITKMKITKLPQSTIGMRMTTRRKKVQLCGCRWKSVSWHEKNNRQNIIGWNKPIPLSSKYVPRWNKSATRTRRRIALLCPWVVVQQRPQSIWTSSVYVSLSCLYVATSLLAGHVRDVCLVYEHSTTGNSWNEHTITQAFFARMEPDTKALITPSNMARIYTSDADHVKHPYFRHTKRYGLANVTKKGEECRIFFNKNKKKTKKENEEKRIEKIMNWYPNVFYQLKPVAVLSSLFPYY